eukprot:Em0001g2783a
MTAGFVLVQIAIAVIWLVIERPGIDFNFSDTVTEIKCSESPHIGLSVTLGYNLILLICSTYYAFRTRKIPQNFNEAKFINLTLYTICILTECRTSPTLGISDHLSGAYGPQLQRLLHQPGDTIRSRWQGVEVMVRSSAAGGHDDRGRIPHPDDYGV